MNAKKMATILVVACFGLTAGCTKDQEPPASAGGEFGCLGCTALSAVPETPDPCHGKCVEGETCVPAPGGIDGDCVDSLCADGDPCTDDSGDPMTGCVHTGKVCADDGNGCNGTPFCELGICVSTAPLDCGDGDACTTDSCDPLAGCLHVALNCSDGNVCDGIETCDAVAGCQEGALLNCSDGNQCTTDGCNPAVGCSFTPVVPCDFGEICGNFVDDDGDGGMDCADSECGAAAFAYLIHVLSPQAQVSFSSTGFRSASTSRRSLRHSPSSATPSAAASCPSP